MIEIMIFNCCFQDKKTKKQKVYKNGFALFHEEQAGQIKQENPGINTKQVYQKAQDAWDALPETQKQVGVHFGSST